MSLGLSAASTSGAYRVPVKPPAQTHVADPVQAVQQAAAARARIVTAQQALASANGVVDEDKRNHSPGCVACDQKLVDKAQAQLAQAKTSERTQVSQPSNPVGSTLDIIV
jgi:hypothetical protein